MNNWQEWKAGTVPTNAASLLQILTPTNATVGVNVSWSSVNGVNYFVQRSASLENPAAFTTLQSNLVGQVGTTIYTDSSATNGGQFFYRVGVQ